MAIKNNIITESYTGTTIHKNSSLGYYRNTTKLLKDPGITQRTSNQENQLGYEVLQQNQFENFPICTIVAGFPCMPLDQVSFGVAQVVPSSYCLDPTLGFAVANTIAADPVSLPLLLAALVEVEMSRLLLSSLVFQYCHLAWLCYFDLNWLCVCGMLEFAYYWIAVILWRRRRFFCSWCACVSVLLLILSCLIRSVYSSLEKGGPIRCARSG
nr:uncharacterized protein LOC112275854 [Physcomitrium patens]|eukprot:XP_024362304.1 uncharacterized protein LOC112275854 [Physcomitrella patens]